MIYVKDLHKHLSLIHISTSFMRPALRFMRISGRSGLEATRYIGMIIAKLNLCCAGAEDMS